MHLRLPRRPWLALVWAAAGCLPAPGDPASPRAAAAPAPTGLEVAVDERFYDVDGTTAWSVNRDLAQNAPRLDGARVHGLTDFRVRYSYSTRPWGEGCRAVETRVRVEVVTTLPLWAERDDAPEPLRRDWDLFLARLREHERGHQEIAIASGRELLARVEALRAPDCDALLADAERLAEALQDQVDVDQRGWDEATANGRLEGT